MEASSIALYLDQFTHFGSLTSLLPYLSIYYLDYAQTSAEIFGLLVFSALVVGIILNFGIHLLNIRYETYTLTYFISWTCAVFSFTTLFLPVIFVTPLKKTHPIPEVSLQILNATTEEADSFLQEYPSDLRWSLLVHVCIFIGLLTTLISRQTCYQINSKLVTHLGTNSPLIRVSGCAGAIIAQISLHAISPGDEFLFFIPILLTYTVLSIVNLAIRTMFNFDRPLQQLSDESDKLEESVEGTVFYKTTKYWFKKKVLNERNEEVWFVGSNTNYGFDTKDDEYFRNIRRCSLAPLGDSYQIKQFELDTKTKTHFNHVTKIEPRQKECIEVPVIEYDIERLQGYLKHNLEEKCEVNYNLGFYIELIKIVISRNRFYLRLWLLITLMGYFIGSKSSYATLSLYSKNADKFQQMGVYILIAGFIGQSFINLPCISGILSHFKYSTSFSIIFIFQALSLCSLSAYSICNNNTILQEHLILSELLLSFHLGWFILLLDSLIYSYEPEVEHCIDDLVELGRINDNLKTRKKIGNILRMFIINLSVGILLPFGLAMGSLISGIIVTRCGFSALWLLNTVLSLLIGISNHLSCIIYNMCNNS